MFAWQNHNRPAIKWLHYLLKRSSRPIDGKVASCLSSTIVERFGFGSGSDKLQTALNDVESELKKTDVPNHGRAWLESLKRKIQEAIKTSPWNNSEQEYLGWS